MKNRHYYSIYDLMSDELKASHNTGYKLRQNFSEQSSEGLWGLLSSLVSEEGLGTDDKYTRTLWCKYLWPKIHNNKVTYLDSCRKPEEEQLTELKQELVSNIALWLEETYGDFVTRINYYDSQVESLNDSIKSTVFNRFNDTPQASETGFDSDSYATTTNKTVSESSGGTPVQRLAEILNFIQDLYQQWADDFINRFVILGVK